MVLELHNGTYSIDIPPTGFVFNASILASSVRIVGQAGAVILFATSSTEWLFDVREGAPVVELRLLHLRAPVRISGGALEVRSCEFDACQSTLGGALLLTGGSLRAEDTAFTRNQAESGGALFASGGLASFARCSFRQNAALVSGGAILLSGTAEVILSDGSALLGNALVGNSASGAISSIHRASGRFSYVLPAPLGRWIDSSGGTTAYPLANATSLDFDYPYPCAPGLVGRGLSLEVQSRPSCSGLCSAGYICGGATSVLVPCLQGHVMRVGFKLTWPYPCKPEPRDLQGRFCHVSLSRLQLKIVWFWLTGFVSHS